MNIRVVSSAGTVYITQRLLGMGETARVFEAYTEAPSRLTKVAIKLAKDQRYNGYIEEEYKTLTALRALLLSRSTRTGLPLPKVELGALQEEGRKALIMEPLLEHSLLQAFETQNSFIAREILAINAAKQYADLLQALVDSNRSCLDRKLGDLWWVSQSEQLIVTDWNVVDQSAHPAADIRRFGLLWFELLIGHQMPSHFQPKREDYDKVQDRVSYGVWYLIGRAVASGMGAQFRSIQQLSHTLNDLSQWYEQSPEQLAHDGRSHLEMANANLEQAKADQAWIQLDIAKRRGANVQPTEIEQARLWAQNPITQAGQNLLEKLSSYKFTPAAIQINELEQKVKSPQKLGEIQRLSYGFRLLETTQELLINGGATRQLFKNVQNTLVEGVLRPLMAKDGSTAKTHVEKIRQVLAPYTGHESLEVLDSLGYEALFWEQYLEAQNILDTNPESSITILNKARLIRGRITHWPPQYEPTTEHIHKLIELAKSTLHSIILSGQAAKEAEAKEFDTFVWRLSEELAKGRWIEGTGVVISMLKRYSQDNIVREEAENWVRKLLQKRTELQNSHSTPVRLADRKKVLNALLELPTSLMPQIPPEEELQRELEEIEQIENKIRHAQRALFQNPAQVLQQATKEKYELFDDPALSVTVLKTIHQVGRWDSHQFENEIWRLEKLAENLKKATNYANQITKEFEATRDHSQQLTANFPALLEQPAQQIEKLFAEKKFEQCREILAHLPNHEPRQKWATRINDAMQLKEIVAVVQTWNTRSFDDAYFWKRRKQKQAKIEVYRRALIKLVQCTESYQFDPHAYALYEDQIHLLYERIWAKLQKLDKKEAKEFKGNLRER
ncbi:MAG: hypothetical protein ACPGWR_23210 [Ardenticatenaceae bacterium]